MTARTFLFAHVRRLKWITQTFGPLTPFQTRLLSEACEIRPFPEPSKADVSRLIQAFRDAPDAARRTMAVLKRSIEAVYASPNPDGPLDPLLDESCPDCPLGKCVRYDPNDPRSCPWDRATGYVGDFKEGHPKRAVPAKVVPMRTRRTK